MKIDVNENYDKYLLVIRKARKEDSLSIAIVNAYTWKTQYTGLMPDSIIDDRIKNIEQLARKIESRIDKENECIVAQLNNTIIGFCRYGKSRNDKYKDSGEIYALYLLEGFKGKGIGRKLFEFAKQSLKSSNYNSMIINCLKGNSTLEFYKHMGGKVIDSTKMETNNIVLYEDIVYYDI